MEINHYGDTLLGLVAQENIVEGRMILLTTNVHSRNFGSQTDLPGAKLPDDATESTRAKFCVAFEQEDRKSTRLNSSHCSRSRMPSSA